VSRLDLVVKSRSVFTGKEFEPASILIADGRIQKIAPLDFAVPGESPCDDYGSVPILPGLIDTHVHINEPGRTEWEGFASATKAAAAGGITTLIDMPLNSIPSTVTVAALEEKKAAAQDQLYVDCGFYGGLIPGHARHIEPLVDAGVFGFKCFLIDSGVQEFPHVRESDLLEGIPLIARSNVPLLAHCELITENSPLPAQSGDPGSFLSFLQSRPPALERAAIELMARLSGDFGAAVHVVHLSDATSLDVIEKARSSGARLTVETCPHYLTLNAEDVPAGNTLYKCTPPIREKKNQEELWRGLLSGHIDMVVSDHSPCSLDRKLLPQGDFFRAWGGIGSLQYTLSATWTAARARGLPLGQVVAWFSEKPADFVRLTGRKGRIGAGYDADLLVWAPEENFTITEQNTFHKHPLSPYTGLYLYGKTKATYLRGQLIYTEAGHRQQIGQMLFR